MPTLRISRYQNDMGGTSLIIPSGVSLPNAVQSRLTSAELAFLAAPSSGLLRLAQSSPLEAMASWLRALAKRGLLALELHTSEVDVIPPATLFRFKATGKLRPAIALPSTPPCTHISGVLHAVYSVVATIKHWEWADAGGLDPLDSPISIGASGLPVDGVREASPSSCYPFYSTHSGDALCFTRSGQAVWYNHEVAGLFLAGPLEAQLARYFSLLQSGRELSGAAV